MFCCVVGVNAVDFICQQFNWFLFLFKCRTLTVLEIVEEETDLLKTATGQGMKCTEISSCEQTSTDR